MKKTLSINTFKPRLRERSSMYSDQQETSSSTNRSSRHIILSKLSSRTKSYRSIINCESLVDLKTDRKIFKDDSPLFKDLKNEIQPINEKIWDTSYQEEDSLIQELADILTLNEKIKVKPRKEIEIKPFSIKM